jgi:hypothetical protein
MLGKLIFKKSDVEDFMKTRNQKNSIGFKCRGINSNTYLSSSPEYGDFLKMLEYFGVENSLGYILNCVDSWYFAKPFSSILDWASLDSDPDLKGLVEISHIPDDPNYYLTVFSKDQNGIKVNDLEINKRSGIFISRGKTTCDDSCLFYHCCDGEVGSEFNPSSKNIPCNKFNLNKNEILIRE